MNPSHTIMESGALYFLAQQAADVLANDVVSHWMAAALPLGWTMDDLVLAVQQAAGRGGLAVAMMTGDTIVFRTDSTPYLHHRK